MRSGMGWTPRLTENTRLQAAARESQERVAWLRPVCQAARWSPSRRMVANTARLSTVAAAEARYMVRRL